MLFADVKGSMELGEKVDPEEWYRIMDRFFQILSHGVHRFEGTVDKFTGDGIMAIFGAPIAHEGHAQRACYAALHLRDELRRYADELRRTAALNFSVRMGLNSGEVPTPGSPTMPTTCAFPSSALPVWSQQRPARGHRQDHATTQSVTTRAREVLQASYPLFEMA